MNTRPTFDSLSPVEAGPFNTYSHRDAARRLRYHPTSTTLAANVLPAAFNAGDVVLPTAVEAIRKAFLLAKTSHQGWKSIQREGRFDTRQAPRIGHGAQDVFKRKVGRSTTRVKVSVLIDSSGSMNNQDANIANPNMPTRMVGVSRRLAAAVFGATVAKALGTVPTVDLDVYQHAAGLDDRMYLKWRWAKGTPVAVFNEAAVHGLAAGGNADGHALFAITSRMQREIRRDERGIILIVSDGLPSVYASNNTVDRPEKKVGENEVYYRGRVMEYQAGQALIDAVAHARKAGYEVIAVAIDGSDQSVYYGPTGVIKFDGNWNALGAELARHIGKALAAR